MKRFLTCLCLIVTSLALCSGLAGAAEKVRINLLSTPFGTGSYVLGTALENIVNKGDYPILISHAETPGQAFNVNKLNADPAARKNTVGTAAHRQLHLYGYLARHCGRIHQVHQRPARQAHRHGPHPPGHLGLRA